MLLPDLDGSANTSIQLASILRKFFFKRILFYFISYSIIYTNDCGLHIIAIADDGDLKNVTKFAMKLHP